MSYRRRRSGRRPLTVAALTPALALLAAGLVRGAPWYILALWLLATAGLAGLVLRNPIAGLSLDGEGLRATDGARTVEIARAEILRMEMENWTDGPDRWTALLAAGRRVVLPDRASPPRAAFAAALAAAGIEVADR